MGYGFVKYNDASAAKIAVEKLNKLKIDNKILKVYHKLFKDNTCSPKVYLLVD